MGLFMRPILGLLGAGVATCISNCVACAYFIVVVLRSGKGAVVTFSPRVGLAERSSISAVFAVGVPSAVTSFLFDLDYVILDRLMTSYNDLALASSFLRARVLATPLMFMSFFTVYLFQAFGKGNISLLLGTVRWLGFNIPMLYLLNHLVGMYGLVWSQVTADSLNVIVSIIVYLRFRPPLLRRDAAKAEP